MAGWIKPKDVPPEPASPVVVLDETEFVERLDEPISQAEGQLLAMLKAQTLARLQKAQATIDRRAQERAKDADAERFEREELWTAGEELRAIEAKEAAEVARIERERLNKIAYEYERSDAQANLVKNSIEAYKTQTQNVTGDAVLACQGVWRNRFRTEPPPYDLWTADGPNQASVTIFGGRIICQVDCRIGLDSPTIAFLGAHEPIPGLGVLDVPDAAAIGKFAADYRPEAEKLFGVGVDELPEKPQGDLDISMFGVNR